VDEWYAAPEHHRPSKLSNAKHGNYTLINLFTHLVCIYVAPLLTDQASINGTEQF